MRRLDLFLSGVVFLLLLSLFSNAQPPPPNCPPALSAGFDITGDSVSVCNDGVNLTVTGFSTLNSTDSYSVNPIPYNPYPWVGANAVIVGQDDIWSGIVNLPFDFCFFGTKYNQVVIGANGQVGFDITQAGLGNAWNLNTPPIVAPNANAAMNNTIMAPYLDLDPSVGNTANITWDIYGTAPCRYLVVSWDSVPMFSCNTSFCSQQVVLFESTYLIDINIRDKPACNTWNGGRAIQGVQNATGTSAFTVPGRNSTQWQATNDSYRFTPAGVNTVQYLYTWIDVNTNTVLGTGPNLTYTPVINTQVTVQCQAITDCDTIQAAIADTIDIIVTGLVQAAFDYDVMLGCDFDSVQFTNLSVNGTTGTINYFWNFGDGNFSSDPNPLHIYGVQGNYTVTLISSANGCSDTISTQVNVNHPISASFDTAPDSVCFGNPIVFSNTSQATLPIPMPNLFVNSWDMGDGTTVINNTAQFPYTYAAPGTYTVKLVITDTLGCQDSITHVVFVEDSSFVSMTASPTEVCLGNYVQFTDQYAAHTVNRIYDFGDGTILSGLHNPRHTYELPGTYTATFTGQYLICPEESESITIQVNDYPLLNLGPDTSYCPGLTQPITLSNIDNPSQILQWSDGSSGPTLEVDGFGRYWATVSNLNCASSDSIWVRRDCYLNIPNSFSPNGDGRNDYFIPRQLLSQGLQEFSMKIFNRWGEIIFETNRLDGRGWDGKFGGDNQPVGTYVYIIDAQWNNNYRNSFKGNVTLMR